MPDIEEVVPPYLQIAEYYRSLIDQGVLQPGYRLPSEREMTTIWKVSRPTATRALQRLSAQGVVARHRGSGTYVRERHQAIRPPDLNEDLPYIVPARDKAHLRKVVKTLLDLGTSFAVIGDELEIRTTKRGAQGLGLEE
jgi:DNA-binding GntR family transcriptional regulator